MSRRAATAPGRNSLSQYRRSEGRDLPVASLADYLIPPPTAAGSIGATARPYVHGPGAPLYRRRSNPVAAENRIRDGADAAMGFPRFGMLDLLKLLSRLPIRLCSDRMRLARPKRHFSASSGAPRIHDELLKLDIDIAQSTVAKYLSRRRGPRSPGWQPGSRICRCGRRARRSPLGHCRRLRTAGACR